jgi:hypothetical protein
MSQQGPQDHQDADDAEAADAYLHAARTHLDSAAERALTSPWRLMALDEASRQITRAIEAQARAMREDGASWARIGACLGVTAAAAEQRFGDLIIDSGRGGRGADGGARSEQPHERRE